MARVAVIDDNEKQYTIKTTLIGIKTVDIAKLYTKNGLTIIKLYKNKKEKRER